MLRIDRSYAALAALCLCAWAQPCPADAQTVTNFMKVSLRDLDLCDERDVRTVRRRIEAAEAYVCDAPGDAVTPDSGDECISSALEGANAQLEVALAQARRHLALGRPEARPTSERQ